jgi:hypothetical protein
MARSKFEIKTQKTLEAEGYLIDWKIRPTRPNPYYNTDYFNLFDLIAYKEGEPVRWISVKGTMGLLKTHWQEIKDFKMPEGNQKEVWWYRKLASDKRKFVPKIVIID